MSADALRLCGVNHHAAPLAVREALAFAPARAAAVLRRVREAGGEGVLVCTCNRTELYCAAEAVPDLLPWLAEEAGVPADKLRPLAQELAGPEVLRHLLEVCVGLDSMVLGEAQILGQVRRAYQEAAAAGFVGPALHFTFQEALAVAKRVRAESGIDRGRTSVGSVAADLASGVFSSLAGKTVLAVGAGEMGKVALTHLAALKPARVILCNRSPTRAAELADALAAALGERPEVRPLEDMEALLPQAHLAVFSTAAPHPLLTHAKAKSLARAHAPLLILDLAVPRNVEEAVARLENVYLYNLDDLQRVLEGTAAERAQKGAACRAAIDAGVAQMRAALAHRGQGEVIRRLRGKVEALLKAEEERLAARLRGAAPGLGEAELARLLAEHHHRVAGKLLHEPMSRLKAGVGDPALALALEHLFALEQAEEAPPSEPPAAPEPEPRIG